MIITRDIFFVCIPAVCYRFLSEVVYASCQRLCGGRKLIAPDGFDVRPTTDKVKESVFNIIQFEIEGRRMLDLFAGSGQMGIEALSRGAEHVVFVDNSRKSLDAVRQNVSAVGFTDRATVIYGDSLDYLRRCGQKFGIVFLDPPYHNGLIPRVFELLPDLLERGAVVICETKSDEALPDGFGGFTAVKTYKYSSIKITLYRNKNTAEVE